MVDNTINIRGMKQFAADHTGKVPNPFKAKPTGKTVAVIGGGPGGPSSRCLRCSHFGYGVFSGSWIRRPHPVFP